MTKILVINGPNLNVLGQREPATYGYETLTDIEQHLSTIASELDTQIDFFQSNAEHLIIERLHQLFSDPVDAVIINPAAFTHTSVAIRDAILAVNVPFYEVHLSNLHKREEFRHHSFFSDIALAVICGMGSAGYEYALQDAVKRFKHQ
jgi:3-dehydroquinate dehydratase-2